MGDTHMRSTTEEYLVRRKKNRQKQRRFYSVVLLLSVAVAVGVGWTLRLSGLTLAGDSCCGMEEHKHTDACWEERLICNQEESQGHVHSAACYEEEKRLNCAMEHEHSEECYRSEPVLICTQQECEGHRHTDGCRERVLICGKEEHVHDSLCYADVHADVETPAEWEKTLPETLSGIWAEDLIAVAESQVGYTESDRNYTVDLEGTRRGYTRYGQWYDSCYTKWDAMFVSWCLHYAKIVEEAVPYGMDCQTMATRMQEKNLYKQSAGYAPVPGDIVFLDLNEDGVADQTGIVTAATENSIQTIEGDSDDRVQKEEHGLADEAILGYGSLPQNPALIEQGPEEEPVSEAEHPKAQDDPFRWEACQYDYIYQGQYKNSNYQVTSIGENAPVTVGTKVLVPGNAAQPWRPDGIPWVPGSSNYQVAYSADMGREPEVKAGYRVERLNDTEYLTRTQKASLSRILVHSYPFIGAEQMMQEMQDAGVDCSGIGIAEMMSGAQQAIWKITNGIDCMDGGKTASDEETEITQMLPLESAEMGEVNGARAQKAAQTVKEYLLGLSGEESASVLEIQELTVSDQSEDEAGIKTVSVRIVLNRPVSADDKNLALTVFWGEQEQPLEMQLGDQEIEVQLAGGTPDDQVQARLTGTTEGFRELQYYVGCQADGAVEAAPNLVGGYVYAQDIASEKQAAVTKGVLSAGFPKPELTQMIAESGVDFNRLIWRRPETTGRIFGSATEYCLFTLDDFTVTQGSEIIGGAAVGGVFHNRGERPLSQIGRGNGLGNGIEHSCTKADLNFIVGDHVDGYFQGDIWGWLASGNACDLSADGTDSGIMTKTAFLENDQAESYSEWYIYGDYDGHGGITVSELLDSYFTEARKDLLQASEAYRKPIAGTTGTAELDATQHLVLTGNDPAFNFFEVTVSQINAAKGINIYVPKDAYVQVNVQGSERLEFNAHNVRSSMMVPEDAKDPWGNPMKDVLINAYDIAFQNYGDSMEACRHLFWNMPDVTEIVTKTPFAGSILAPKAHLQVDGVNVNGSIIVESVTLNNSGGEFHNYPFDYENWPDGTPKTSVQVTKVWVGAPAEKAEVELVANGVPTGMKVLLTAQNNWTYAFTDLPVNENGVPIEYTVVETEIPGYTSGISGDAEHGFVITNTKDTYECDFKIQKQSTDGAEPLQGAEFKLYREAENGSELLEQLPGVKLTEIPGTFITGADGSITVDQLLSGIYYLMETKAPDGYALLEEPVCIKLTQDTVVVEGDNALAKGSSERVELPILTVQNKPGYRLPETGGNGTLYYTSAGVLLMAVPLMCCVNGYRKSKKGMK